MNLILAMRFIRIPQEVEQQSCLVYGGLKMIWISPMLVGVASYCLFSLTTKWAPGYN